MKNKINIQKELDRLHRILKEPKIKKERIALEFNPYFQKKPKSPKDYNY